MKFPGRRLHALLFSTVIVALTAMPTQAAILTVTNTNDSGAGSLRDTIAATSDGDTIQFDPALNGQAITLTSAQLEIINKSINIEGPGASQLTVQRSTATDTPAFRIFSIRCNTPVTITGLTISNGNEPESGGGGIAANAEPLTLARCVISGNSASSGGGIFSSDSIVSRTVNITNCTISGNSATRGGAIYILGPGFYGHSGGYVTVVDSSISGNVATDSGGGIFNEGHLTMVNSTISTNMATATGSSGGGILNFGTSTITNSTLSGNSASLGGGILNNGGSFFDPGISAITNGTISGNSASEGGGIYQGPYGTQRFKNTLIAQNTSSTSPDVSGEITSDGFNLIGNNAGATITPVQTSDLIGTPASPIDPLLGPLQNNGGPTATHALLPGSPALDQGESSSSTTDQRHFHRPLDLPDVANANGGDGADIGALESAPATLANISTRLRVDSGDNAVIGGFIITGTEPKTVIVRGLGPSLPVSGALADPVLEVHGSAGELIASNDNWRDAATRQEIIDSGLSPTNDLESSLWVILDPGVYTVVVRGKDNAAGTALFEVYDLDQSVNSKLANISTRGFVETGNDVMIGGIILIGSTPTKVLLRAIGPSLANSGVPNPLADPVLELYDGNGGLIATNYDWRDTQEAEIMATGIPPTNDLESAIVRDLSPGNYTAIVHGVNNATGAALVEIYNLK
jgi:hypothetical protein